MQCWCFNTIPHPQADQAMSINSMCMNAKRKRRRVLLWQSNNSDSQRYTVCTAHIYGSRGCRVGLMHMVGKTKIWARDASVATPHTCKIGSALSFLLQCPRSPASSSCCLHYMQGMDLQPSLLLWAESVRLLGLSR